MVVKYKSPERWIHYDSHQLVEELIQAKAVVLSLTSIPYQRAWAEELQEVQLKHEVAGTSRIEGADFTERELELALRDETPEQRLTRSQKQARAAVHTYRWIAQLPDDRPIDSGLICEVHRRIVTGCDDDHCVPGKLRARDENVVFGTPPHRGVEGGPECERVFSQLCESLQSEYQGHDPLIQALALHYHVGAMHPFLDGNGRTARAVEALLLQRAGLRDEVFIAMSNYYYDEKSGYLAALTKTAATGHDLTHFLKFGLLGISIQCQRLLTEIQTHVRKVLFRDVMYRLFSRLRSERKRAMGERQINIAKRLLATDELQVAATDLYESLESSYASLKNPWKAFLRDLMRLVALGAIELKWVGTGDNRKVQAHLRLEWPTEITETKFFEAVNKLPKAKTHGFLQ